MSHHQRLEILLLVDWLCVLYRSRWGFYLYIYTIMLHIYLHNRLCRRSVPSASAQGCNSFFSLSTAAGAAAAESARPLGRLGLLLLLAAVPPLLLPRSLMTICPAQSGGLAILASPSLSWIKIVCDSLMGLSLISNDFSKIKNHFWISEILKMSGIPFEILNMPDIIKKLVYWIIEGNFEFRAKDSGHLKRKINFLKDLFKRGRKGLLQRIR